MRILYCKMKAHFIAYALHCIGERNNLLRASGLTDSGSDNNSRQTSNNLDFYTKILEQSKGLRVFFLAASAELHK